METSKLCLICLCEKKQNVLIPFSTQLTDIQNELKAIRGSCHNTHPSNDKMDWSSIEHLKIGEMLVDCSPEKINSIENPQYRMCRDCIRNLITAYLFRLQCRKAIRQLNKPLSRHCNESAISEENKHDIKNVFVQSEKTDVKENMDYSVKTDDNGMNSGVIDELCNDTVDRQKVEHDSTVDHLLSHEPKTARTEREQKRTQNEVYECYDCKKQFKYMAILKYHLFNQHNENGRRKLRYQLPGKHQCTVCGRIYKFEYTLKRHSYTHLSEESRNENNELTSTDSLKNHSEQHSETLFNCKSCDAKFQNNTELNAHTKEHHAIEWPYLCGQCGNLFQHGWQLAHHIKLHARNTAPEAIIEKTEQKPEHVEKIDFYECYQCKKQYKFLSMLKRHLLEHDKDKNKNLNYNSKVYQQPGQYKCTVCRRIYKYEYTLKRHSYTHLSEECRNKNKKKYECSVCLSVLTSSGALKRHSILHSETRFNCKSCDAKFQNNIELNAHKQLHHTTDLPFLCGQCGRLFRRRWQFEDHMLAHSGEKPYKCDYCEKSFGRRRLLYKHEQRHLGNRSHFCHICGKGFYDKCTLDIHLRMHTGERPFECPHCKKRLRQRRDFIIHLRIHSGERIKCDKCDADFIALYLLNRHKRHEHGINIEAYNKPLNKILPKR